MTTLAVLDPHIPTQIRENPRGLEGIDVVYSGTSLDRVRELGKTRPPDVVVVHTEILGPKPASAARQLLSDSRAKLVIALYTYAKREFIQAMNGQGIRAMKAPTSLEQLRSQMMSVIVKSLLSNAPQNVVPPVDANAPAVAPGAEARRFSDDALARLCEIESAVDCECPNHLAQIIAGLAAFERYSASCENRDEKDAAMHRKLAQASGRARATMETALEALLVHEGIAL